MFPYSSWSLATLCDCRNMGLQFEPNDHAQHVLRGQRQVRMSLLSPSVPTLSYSLPPKENMAVVGCLKICIPKILLLTTQSSSWDDHSIKYGNEKKIHLISSNYRLFVSQLETSIHREWSIFPIFSHDFLYSSGIYNPLDQPNNQLDIAWPSWPGIVHCILDLYVLGHQEVCCGAYMPFLWRKKRLHGFTPVTQGQSSKWWNIVVW